MGSWTNTLCAGMCAVYSFFGVTLAISMRDFCELNRRRLRQLLRQPLRPWPRAFGCCRGQTQSAPLFARSLRRLLLLPLLLLLLPLLQRYLSVYSPRHNRSCLHPPPPTPPLFLSPLAPFSTLPQGAQIAQGSGRCTNIIHWGTRRRFIFLTILPISSSTLPPRPTFSLATGMSPMRADSGLHAA